MRSARSTMCVTSPTSAIRWSSFPSDVSERAERGSPITMNQFVGFFTRDINWSTVLLNWVRTVGKDRMDLRLQDRNVLVGGDLLEDFCQALGLSRDGLKAPVHDNLSLTLPGLLAMRRSAEQLSPVDAGKGGVNPRFKTSVQRVMALTKNGQKLRLNAAQRARVVVATAYCRNSCTRPSFPMRRIWSRQRATPGG